MIVILWPQLLPRKKLGGGKGKVRLIAFVYANSNGVVTLKNANLRLILISWP